MKCDYGCGEESHFTLKNGKVCCSSSYTKCPGMKHKFNSINNRKLKCERCGKELPAASFSAHLDKCLAGRCVYCGMMIDKGKKFCNSKCSALYSNYHSELLKKCKRGPKTGNYTSHGCVNICRNCGKVISGEKFCNMSCKCEYDRDRQIFKWLCGELSGTCPSGAKSYVKFWALRNSKFSCSACGWNKLNPYTRNSTLEVDHIDGDSSNNASENIRILCPNCHSLTSTYKGSNKNSCRTYRKKYYACVAQG